MSANTSSPPAERPARPGTSAAVLWIAGFFLGGLALVHFVGGASERTTSLEEALGAEVTEISL